VRPVTRRELLACVPTSFWVASVVQTVFLVALYATDGYDAARSGEGLRLALTYATLAALFGLVHVVAGSRSRLAGVTTFVVFAAFVLVNFARFETTGAFDYGFVHENVRELATPFGRRLVTAQVKPLEILAFLVVPLASGLVFLRWRAREWPWSRRARVLTAVGCAAVVLGVPAAGLTTHESLTVFTTSAYRFHAVSSRADAAIGTAPFPLVHEFVPSQEARDAAGPTGKRPHVIVLFLESWSAIYEGRIGPDGVPYTPVFDARRREALTFEHFYASSIQSSRGRFATMCSLIPLHRGKEFRDLADAPLHCLPHVLRDAGYTTLISSASDEPEFERSNVFFGQLGFEDIRFEDPAARGRDPNVWGAGLRDDVFYKKFFASLDDKLAAAPDAPLFAVAINASNHYPFDKNTLQVPGPGATKYARNYVASLRAADAWLVTFYEELERRESLRDALVVLIGDHSFPADEHGVHFNGRGANEESFRTGFALRWPGHVAPKVVTDSTASQLDLGPTVADLLQIRHQSHFVGRSLMVHDGGRTAVPMVQPYDGVRLVAVRFPFKLEVHDAADQEHLYDLSLDPDEQHDRIDDPALAKEAAQLRSTIEDIRRSQAILRARRIWPPASL
jgi:arylsulfatase A-like enzyme